MAVDCPVWSTLPPFLPTLLGRCSGKRTRCYCAMLSTPTMCRVAASALPPTSPSAVAVVAVATRLRSTATYRLGTVLYCTACIRATNSWSMPLSIRTPALLHCCMCVTVTAPVCALPIGTHSAVSTVVLSATTGPLVVVLAVCCSPCLATGSGCSCATTATRAPYPVCSVRNFPTSNLVGTVVSLVLLSLGSHSPLPPPLVLVFSPHYLFC
uniref:Alanine--tRNA ligase n=1 Tax=Lygus hesperus TaxID=30085 RepID=A0A0A9XT45_LYGHE